MISVVTLGPAIFLTLLLPLIFAILVLAARRMVRTTGQWYSVFAFPVFFTAFEFLVLQYSRDGSAGSVAYTQSNILPIVQIASVAGILGITFFITFIPSAIAVAWHFRKQKKKFRFTARIGVIVTALVIFAGSLRLILNPPGTQSSIKVGLAVLDEKSHYITQHPDIEKEKQSAKNYAEFVSQLANGGARLVVLPERALNIDPQTESTLTNILSSTAGQKNVFIVSGYTNFKTAAHRNSSLVIDANGRLVVDYNKVYLVPGLEKQFTPGSSIGLFEFNNIKTGTAICKDLDFPSYIKNYGVAGIDFLNIPAWDFVTDDWLHSRMAILRGVENGFSEVRTARQGRLTISDAYGRVIAEANSSSGKAVTLTGNVPIQKLNTIYNRWGNWFGIANIIAALFFIFLIVTMKKHNDKALWAI
jgi:apolipoprotein N-acyltransferase